MGEDPLTDYKVSWIRLELNGLSIYSSYINFTSQFSLIVKVVAVIISLSTHSVSRTDITIRFEYNICSR